MIGRRPAARRLRALTGAPAARRRPVAVLVARPRIALASAALVAGLSAFLAAGPVAALAAAVYAALGVRLVRSRELNRARAQAEAVAMDAVVALAADLRAGQPASTAMPLLAPALTPAGRGPNGHVPGGRAVPLVGLIRERTRAAVHVAGAAGAPLADLLDRLDADLRARRTAALHSAAQAAGASATSWLLAGLPLAGVGLGYGLGVDPAQELLHTRLGAVCVVLALAFQLAGLAWVARISRSAGEVAG